MRRVTRSMAVMLAASMMLSGCYGPFLLTKKLHTWNGSVGDKWAQEVVFLVCVIAPVYSFVSLADAILFNSLEFWTGNNPMATAAAPTTKRIVRGDAEADLTFDSTPGHEQMVIRQSKNGAAAGDVRISRLDGLTVATNDVGDILFTAETMADGGVIVHDAQGKAVKSFSPEKLAQLKRSVQ